MTTAGPDSKSHPSHIVSLQPAAAERCAQSQGPSRNEWRVDKGRGRMWRVAAADSEWRVAGRGVQGRGSARAGSPRRARRGRRRRRWPTLGGLRRRGSASKEAVTCRHQLARCPSLYCKMVMSISTLLKSVKKGSKNSVRQIQHQECDKGKIET